MKKLRKAYIALIMAFLYAPIVLLILYSFNDSKSRANWGGFTLRWYKELFSDAAIMSALSTTLSVGLLAAVFSTLLGTVGAIALYQMKRLPRKTLLSIVNLPMLNSEVVTGVSLMLLYAMANIQLGYLTLLLSHIAFCVPYVVLSVMPKLRQIDPNLAEAAQDLGATPMPGLLQGDSAGHHAGRVFRLCDGADHVHRRLRGELLHHGLGREQPVHHHLHDGQARHFAEDQRAVHESSLPVCLFCSSG